MYEFVPELLWIGHAHDVRDPRAVLDAGIAAVVDLAYEELPAQLLRNLVYCRFPLVDGADNDPQLLRLAVETVVDLLVAGSPTLVACSAGMSRSPIIASVALSVCRNEPPTQTLQALAESRPHDVSLPLWNDVLKACAEVRRPSSKIK